MEGRKTAVATSTGATTKEDEEKYKFDSMRILLRLTTDDLCYDSYCFRLYSVGGGGSSSSRALLAPRLSPPPRALFSRPPHIFTFPRLSPPPPSRSPATQHQPNPTATVYSLRYLRLLDLLRDERATEPCLRTEDPVEWLAWAHAVRWLIVSPLRLPAVLVLTMGTGSVSCSTRVRVRLPMGTLASPPSIPSRRCSP